MKRNKLATAEEWAYCLGLGFAFGSAGAIFLSSLYEALR